MNFGDVIGGVQDIPVPGDYNGDGKTEAAVWRPRAGASYWYISTAGSAMPWGGIYEGVQDIPLLRR